MKPTRSRSDFSTGSLQRERRTALISLAALLVLLASLILYQRVVPESRPPVQQGAEAELPVVPERAPERGKEAAEQGEAVAPSGTTAVEAPERLGRPLAGDLKVVKPFGAVTRAYGDYRIYPAVAYSASRGDSVLAAAAGTVADVEQHPVDGWVLTLDHGGGLVSRYAGLGSVLPETNASVQAGGIIGQVGRPGLAGIGLGPHLSFQVFLNGDPVDPATYLSR